MSFLIVIEGMERPGQAHLWFVKSFLFDCQQIYRVPRVDIVENPFPRIDHGNNRGELTAQKNFLTPLGGACGIQHGTWEDDTESTSVPKKLPESPGECLVQIYISRS